MSWVTKIISRLGFGSVSAYSGQTGTPLLSLPEKRELERILRAKLLEYHDQNGPTALLQPGVFVVVDSRGPRVQQGRPDEGSYLATVETRALPSALALLAVDQPRIVVPRDIVKFFGTEAASATAAMINELRSKS